MSKILFVVHRYAPFPGGSEYYVQNMAERCHIKGHDVTVLTEKHAGNLNGVKVTSDYQILMQQWDLIVVHGADCSSQNIVHQNAFVINRVSPVLYMIIKPSDSPYAKHGLEHHKFIGYSTTADISYLRENLTDQKKMRFVPHGIVKSETIKTKHKNESKFVAVSAGGFWPHKGMKQLVHAWNTYMPKTSSCELHLYGYGCEENAPKDGPNVFVHKGLPKDAVLQAIADADVYIMNSFEEGYGLVLLEAMANRTPWFARDIAGATDLKINGNIYTTESELFSMIKSYKRDSTEERKLERAYEYVMANRTIDDTVAHIENVLFEVM